MWSACVAQRGDEMRNGGLAEIGDRRRAPAPLAGVLSGRRHEQVGDGIRIGGAGQVRFAFAVQLGGKGVEARAGIEC